LNHRLATHFLVFSPDGRVLAGIIGDYTIRLWHTANNQPDQFLDISAPNTHYNDLAFSPDGKVLASCSDRIIQFWNISDGKLLYELEGHTSQVKKIIFSPDGGLLASLAYKSPVLLWSIPDKKLLLSINSTITYKIKDLPGPRTMSDDIESIAFSSDGQMLLTRGGMKRLRLWDIHSGKLLRDWPTKGSKIGMVNVAFSSKEMLAHEYTQDDPRKEFVQLWGVTDTPSNQKKRGWWQRLFGND